MSAITPSTQNSTFHSVPPGQELEGPDLLLGPLATGIVDLTSSLSSSGRSVHSGWNTWQGINDPVASTALGVTSCFNLVSGIVDARDAHREAGRCRKIKEVYWKVQAQVKIIKSTLTGLIGLVFIPVRALTIAGLFTASKIAVAAQQILGAIGESLASCTCFLMMIGALMGLYRENGFLTQKLKPVLADPQKCLNVLQDELALNVEEKLAIRAKVEKKNLSSWDREAKIDRIEARLLKKKEYLLARVTNQECVDLIKRATAADAPIIVKKVLEANKQRRLLSLEKLLLSSLAIAAIFTAGLVSSVLTIVVGLGWVVFEMYEVYKGFKANEEGKYDKLWLLISTTICMIGIVAFSSLSAGIVPLVIGGVMGIGVLALHSAAYISLRKKAAEKQAADRFKTKFFTLDEASRQSISYLVWEKLHEDREKILLYDKTKDFGREYCLGHPADPVVRWAIEKHLQVNGGPACLREMAS